MDRIEEAVIVMAKMIEFAIIKSRINKINPNDKPAFDALMTEALSKIPCSFASRGELNEWHRKAIKRSEEQMRTQIAALQKT